ncbi:MAG: hypothetical protein FWG55_07870 [Candidatus Bathyarchaeota archaeon]|nr:hypothetical protein [Candidatus Termiticorpusculum sp.]
MSSSSKTGSRRNSGAKFQKSSNQKKTKTKKSKASAKYLNEETAEPTLQDIIEKTRVSIERLGNQTFALSPFSQYYDDWLINLRQAVSRFETSPIVKVDEIFTKERDQAFLDIQTVLAERRMQESTLSEAEKALYIINHDLGDADADYAEKNQELSSKRNSDIRRLTAQVKTLEEDMANQEKLKFSVFQFGAKKTATKKLEQTQQALTSAKNQLEMTLQNFTLEQDKLHDNYVAKKQELSTKSDALHKEIEQLEIDTSIEARKEICTHLNNTINELIKRLPTH